MSPSVRLMAGAPSASPVLTPAGTTRRERASLPVWPQGHWRPRSRASTPSLSDAHLPATVVVHPDALLVWLAELAPGDIRRAAVRARAIEWYLPMAAHLARRFSGRGESLADLTQVAVVGLIKAVDRYDAHRGTEFASYAIPTILGEIKRYFRDTAWHVRVPRGVQELKLKLVPVTEDLTQQLRRVPTTAELAARLGVSQRNVLDAQRSTYAYRPLSLDQPAPDSEDRRLLDTVGGPDRGIDAVERRETLRHRLTELPERERRIIGLRYFAELTQAEIATDMGMSQMHISRLLGRTLTQLRTGMRADTERPTVSRAGATVVARQVKQDFPPRG